eukprot:346921_1
MSNEYERKYGSDHEMQLNNNHSWKNKRMKYWTNEEILDWIRCMKLSKEMNDKIFNVIRSNACTGEDIVSLKTTDDVCNAFNIEQDQILCNKILKQITNFKPILQGN